MIGTRLAGRYELLRELGRGGMGVVYLAHDAVLRREVAIKLLHSPAASPEAEERFLREARMVAQMDHPAIVSVHDVGRHGDTPFLVMPVLHGQNLREALAGGALMLFDLVDIAILVADALAYSHERGVVHRDVKPENIMVSREASASREPGVSPEAGEWRVRVMDFGLARAGHGDRLTRSDMIVGTLTYLSPEQVSGQHLDGRADVYALGTVLYEALCGRPPFSGEMAALVYRIAIESPMPPSAYGARVDDELEQLVLLCLTKEPGKRPRAGELAEALRRYRARHQRDAPEGVPAAVPLDRPSARTRHLTRAPFAVFVGREPELDELKRRLDVALGEEGQLLLLGGEPGVGKTRFLAEAESIAKARRLRVLFGDFGQEEPTLPYEGYCDLIQAAFRSRETSFASPVDLDDLAPELVGLFPVLKEIPALRRAASASLPVSGARRRDERTYVFGLLARTLSRLVAGRPLLLLLENLHRADVSVAALPYIHRALRGAPVLIVGTYRTTEVDRGHPLAKTMASLMGDPRFGSLVLDPFTSAELRAYASSLLDGGELSRRLEDTLYEATQGNAFFGRELVRSLLDAGALEKDAAGAWRLSPDAELTGDSLPHTIQQAVEARLERLPEAARDVCAVASVLGRVFDDDDLQALVGSREVEDDALDVLLRAGILEEERGSRGSRIQFGSGIVRDVVYASLPRRRRKALHRQLAERLEARAAGRPERLAPRLVHHFAEADVPEKTVRYGLLAAGQAVRGFSPEDALRFTRAVLEHLPGEGDDRAAAAEARLLSAEAHRMSGSFDAGLKDAERALHLWAGLGEDAGVVRALLLLAELSWEARRFELTRRWIEQGIPAARRARDDAALCRLLSLAATAANLRGDYEQGAVYLAEIERLTPPAAAGEAPCSEGGTLIVTVAAPLSAADPADIHVDEEVEALANVFETLVTTDPLGRLVPQLAERYEVRDGGRSLRLTLREGVRFHDGSPLDAAAVKRSLEETARRRRGPMPAALSATRGMAELLAGAAELSGVEVLGPGELSIELSEPLPLYPALLTDPLTAIVRRGAGLPSGTGPFRLDAHEAERVVLGRHQGHWRAAPRLDRLVLTTRHRAEDPAALIREGRADVVRDPRPEDLERILHDPTFPGRVVETARKGTYFVLFNTFGKATGDARVRRALAGAARARELVWRVLGPLAQPAAGLLPPGILGHDPGRRPRGLTVPLSTALLHEAGVGALTLRASVHPALRERYGSVTRALFAAWQELGVTVEAPELTMEAFLASLQAGDAYDLLLGRWIADYDDPHDFTAMLFHSEHGDRTAYFRSPEADRLMDEARFETEAPRREALYRRLEEMLLGDDVLLPLFHETDFRVVGALVQGLAPRSAPPYLNYAELWRASPPEPGALEAPETVLEVPVAAGLDTLDPALIFFVGQGEALSNVYETLTRGEGEGTRVRPWLASEVRAEDGGRRFRFRLRGDVRFHDGRRLTARDVRYSFERLLLSRDSEYRSLLQPIAGADAFAAGSAPGLGGFRIESALDFTVELTAPVSFFPALISFPATAIVPEGSERFDSAAACVGTGPFRAVSFQRGRLLELERSRSYWRPGYPRSDRLVFRFGVTPAEAAAGFREGRFALVGDLLPQDVAALRRDPELQAGYLEKPLLCTAFVAFNVHRGPFADRRLRLRFVEAVDIPSLVHESLGALAVPARGLIPPGLLGSEPSLGPRPARMEDDPAALSRPMGPVHLRASVHVTFMGAYAALRRELFRRAGNAGFEFETVEARTADFSAQRLAETADLHPSRWIADYPDPDSFAYSVLHEAAGFLGPFCGTPELTRLAERGRAELDPAVRHAIYRRIEEVIARDALLLPLFYEQTYRFVRPEVDGLTLGFSTPIVSYDALTVRR